jgi:hypothetical protein
MTRTDYKLIADTLKSVKYIAVNSERDEMWFHICYELSQRLNNAQPNFNRDRFLAACGVES